MLLAELVADNESITSTFFKRQKTKFLFKSRCCRSQLDTILVRATGKRKQLLCHITIAAAFVIHNFLLQRALRKLKYRINVEIAFAKTFSREINFPVLQKFLPLWAWLLCWKFLLLWLSLHGNNKTSHKKQHLLAVDVAYLSRIMSYKNIVSYRCVFKPNKISDIIGRSHKKY